MKATLAGGCFWCTEAIFKRLKGVESVTPGYSKPDDIESIQIEFDPSIISYEKLLEVFFKLHDPTTVNRQGADVGTQYRSMIYYHTEEQQKIAEKVKGEVEKSKYYTEPIVTEIARFTNFFKAESYHMDYYDQNRSAPYCQLVIDPKIQKLYRDFKEDLKADTDNPQYS